MEIMLRIIRHTSYIRIKGMHVMEKGMLKQRIIFHFKGGKTMGRMKLCVMSLVMLVMMLTAGTGLCSGREDESKAGMSFEIRNGIHFGMSREEVRETETMPLQKELKNDLLFGKGKVAGIEDSSVQYVFSEDGKLISVIYILKVAPDTPFQQREDYGKIQKALENKYGEPLGYTGGETYYYAGTQLSIWEMPGIRLLIEPDVDVYDEWILDNGDEHVKINHIGFGYSMQGDTQRIHYVEYCYFNSNESQDDL